MLSMLRPVDKTAAGWEEALSWGAVESSEDGWTPGERQVSPTAPPRSGRRSRKIVPRRRPDGISTPARGESEAVALAADRSQGIDDLPLLRCRPDVVPSTGYRKNNESDGLAIFRDPIEISLALL